MPLPEPSSREHLHTRAITFQGFERADGMWDIEAHMTDVKTHGFKNDWRGAVEAGEPLHEMLLRVTIDDDFVVRNIEAATDNSPFEMCPDIAPNYKALIGINMGPGWRKAIRQVVGGTDGCTHLTELLFPMATVAFQTIWPRKQQLQQSGSDTGDNKQRPQILGTCHAWAADSPVVKRNAPKFYTGD
ncbi:MAG: DUF2889 domain-containing protein [Gammaproteobacteria bacterium]|nr:DUF2889 domain-containing protein [Gammaproteobacteria bacterium]